MSREFDTLVEKIQSPEYAGIVNNCRRDGWQPKIRTQNTAGKCAQ